MTGLFCWSSVLESGSAEVGPLGVRRDACPHALLAEFRIGKRAGRARVRSATPSRWSFVLLQSETAGAPCGLFCKRCGVFKGIPSLCKCYNACKVWYRCENGPCRVGIAVKTESVAPPQPAPVSNDRTGTGIGALPSARVCFGEGEVAAGQENGHRSVAVGKGNGNWGRESGIGAGKLPAPIRRSLPQCEPAPCADGYGIHRGAGPATGGYTARPLCGWLGRWPRRPSDDEELRVRCVARSHPRKSAASQGPGPSGCSRGASGADPSTPPVKVRSSSSRSGCG